MDKAPDNKKLSRSDIPFPFESEVGRRLTMGDICHYAPGMLNKIGKEGKTSWDSFSYALMMSHNVYCHIVAVQRANQLTDIEKTRFSPDWREFTRLTEKEINKDCPSDWVPREILYFDRFVTELFETKNKNEAFEMIQKGSVFLKSLEGARLRGGIADNLINEIITFDTVTKSNEIDLNDPEDPKLRKLEKSIR